jgi:hypothetical protein
MLIYDMVEGGVQLNVSDPRIAAVLNQDGIVQIGSSICLFTYGYTKSIKISNNSQQALAILKAATQNDLSKHLYVREVKHTRKPIQLTSANARTAGFDVNYSCDVSSGSPYKWRIIIYSDEIEGNGTASYPICDSGGMCETDDHDYQYSAYVITFRTLSRGFFGGWYDRSSSEQRISGYFTLNGSVSYLNQFVSSLYPGQTRPYNPYTQVDYYKSNTSGETATWQLYLFLSEPEDYSNPQVHCENVRVNAGSVVNATWNSYDCNCSINY